MIPLQLVEASRARRIRSIGEPDRALCAAAAGPVPAPSSVVAVVLSFGALDRRSLPPLGDALRTVSTVATEVALSCDVGVRTFARALTIRLWALDSRRTRTVVEKLAPAACPRGVVLVLSGDLAASVPLVDEALAASDHVERALAPDDLAAALERAQDVLWPGRAAPRAEAAERGTGRVVVPALGSSASGGRGPARHSERRGA